MSDMRVRVGALVVAALVIGFLLGTWRQGARIETGRADSTAEGGGSIITDDWTYAFAVDVPWIDAFDSTHNDGPPECLPPGASVEGVRFGTVEVTIEGATWRPVIWIDCRGLASP